MKKKTALIHNSAIGLTIFLILCLTCGLMSNLTQTDRGTRYQGDAAN